MSFQALASSLALFLLRPVVLVALIAPSAVEGGPCNDKTALFFEGPRIIRECRKAVTCQAQWKTRHAFQTRAARAYRKLWACLPSFCVLRGVRIANDPAFTGCLGNGKLPVPAFHGNSVGSVRSFRSISVRQLMTLVLQRFFLEHMQAEEEHRGLSTECTDGYPVCLSSGQAALGRRLETNVAQAEPCYLLCHGFRWNVLETEPFWRGCSLAEGLRCLPSHRRAAFCCASRTALFTREKR